MGPQIEHELGDTAEVDDAGDIRPLAGGELNRQVLVDRLEGHLVEHDLDVRIGGLEAAEQVLHDLALVSVRVPGHAQRRLCDGRRRECNAADQRGGGKGPQVNH